MTSVGQLMCASARHHKHVSLCVKAASGTHDALLGSLPFQAGFQKRGGVAALRLPGGDRGLNQCRDRLSRWKVPKTKGMVVRSNTTTAAEAAFLDNSSTGASVQKVVIVGAGIAGLSAAVALQRVGIRALVLERSSTIRASGVALSLWGNAWRALEVLGAAEGLRENHSATTRMEMYSNTENVLASFAMNDYPGGPHEMRTVSRKALVQALASQLPAGSIQLNSRVRAIQRQPHERLTKLELENGSVISTMILVGCDGLHSVVGKWLGIPPARYTGAIALLGIAEYPEGHNFRSTFCQYGGRAARVGIIPMTPTSVYWFVGSRKSSPGPKVTDPAVIKQEAIEALREGFPDAVHSLINNTPRENLARAAMYDRLNIPGNSPPFVKDGITLAGDALHPMQPTLGQGACVALEDAVMLGRVVGDALSRPGSAEDEDQAINKALKEYAAERQLRAFPMAVKAFLLAMLWAKRAGRARFIIDNFLLPKLASYIYLSHTLYDVGQLHSLKITQQ